MNRQLVNLGEICEVNVTKLFRDFFSTAFFIANIITDFAK